MHISYSEVITQIIVMALIIATGYVAKHFKVLDDNGDKAISKLIVKVTTPALIISSMSTSLSGKTLSNILIVFIMSVIVLTFTSVVSCYIYLLKGFSDEEKVISRIGMIFGNASYLGFPMCYALFGQIGLLYASIYSATQDTFFWSLGVQILSSDKEKNKYKNLINPCMAAIIIGILILICRIKLPAFLNKSLSTVGNATLPLALIIVGSGFYHVDLRNFKHHILPTLSKLIIFPLIVGLIMHFVPIQPILKNIVFIEISMPCAASIAVVARSYNRDYKLASQMVMIMTALSMITMPLLLIIFRNIL